MCREKNIFFSLLTLFLGTCSVKPLPNTELSFNYTKSAKYLGEYFFRNCLEIISIFGILVRSLKKVMAMQAEFPSGWRNISPREIMGDSTRRLEKEWMLLTAGNRNGGVATMTINWGMFGFIWNKNAVFVSVRKSRNTLPFIEKNKSFSLGIFSEKYRDKLVFCGRNSGKNVDKISHCRFTTLFYDNIPFFSQSNTVLLCNLIYKGDITDDGFIDKDIFTEWYTHGVHTGDMHTFFIASVNEALTRDPD